MTSEATPGALRLNTQLGEAPTRADVDALMKRCQIGVGGRNALDEAHSIMAECYGTLGRQQIEIERLRVLIRRVAKYPASVDCAGTLLRADVLREAGPPENWKA